MTRWTIRHRRIVIGSWILLAGALIALAHIVGSRTATDFTLAHTDSQRATDLLRSRFPAQAGDVDQIVFRARSGRLTDTPMRTAISPMLQRVAALPHVTRVVSPYDAHVHAISASETIGFATVEFDESGWQLPKATTRQLVATANAARSPTLQVELNGLAIEQIQQTSLGFATGVGLVAAVFVLLLTFGSVLAMGLPILTALLGLGAGVGIIGLASNLIDMVDFAPELALMVGLGVGIDYALFILTRFRSAYRDNGGDVAAAVELAMDTAGRAVLVAGVTVVTAMLGLLTLGVSLLYGAAIAASIGVVTVLVASLTLLPALLTLTGRRLGRSRGTPSTKRSRPGIWPRWVAFVQRRLWSAALASAGALAALALPVFNLQVGPNDAGTDPAGQTTHRAYDLLAEGFGPGFNGPLLIAAGLPSAGDTSGLSAVQAALRDVRGIVDVGAPRLSPGHDAAVITVYPTTSPQSGATHSLVNRLRDDVLPPLTARTGVVLHVGGPTAEQIDTMNALGSKLPLFVGVVVLVSCIFLLVVFRSLFIAIQAAFMNLLSIGAALGVVQVMFERGWLSGLLGIEPGPMNAFIPVMVFAIVLGLSMDYEVFLVSRIREEWQRHGDASAAVRRGLLSTGRVITAAAAVMIAVFVSFALGGTRPAKLFGVTTAVAVLLDAFVVRSLLMPAMLEILGRRAWALPRWLDRLLPRFDIEAVNPAAEPELANAAAR